MAKPKAPCEPEGAPNRRRPRESPRGTSRQGKGEGLRPQPGPERGSSKRLRPRKRAPGEWQGLRAAPRSERDFGGLRPREVPRKAGRLRPRAFRNGRPERLRPRCEPRRRYGFGRAGSGKRGATAGILVPARRPDGDRRGALRPLPRPTGCRTGREPRSGVRGKAKRAFAPASRSKAAQREMASPPSDGSQSWDKWGPVATPAPITIPAIASLRPPAIPTHWKSVPGTILRQRVPRLSGAGVTALFF